MSPTDATLNPLPPGVLPAGVEAASGSVITTGLDPALFAFLTPLGLVYLHLFDNKCVITSARDAMHGKGSKHYIGQAVDLRTRNLPPEWQSTFLLVLTVLADRFKLTVFDERNQPGEPHIHVEVAG